MNRPAAPEPAEPGRSLTDLGDAELEALVVALGGRPFQARQAAHWIYRHGAADAAAMRNLPGALRAALARWPVRSTRVLRADRADDGTEKLLLGLADGETVECVIIPDDERTTLCVSTQVGCPVACVFCASGLLGVRRNLRPGEIVEQVLHARDRLGPARPLTNLVVMGMGEPMLNLDNLLAALERIHDPAGIDLGARRITVSTSGYPRQIDRFAESGRAYNLAVSLHAADDALRRALVPSAVHPVRDLVAAAGRHAARTGREATFEVVLLEGRNDRPQDAAALVDLLAGVPCTVNLIPWNPVDAITGLRRPAPARVDAFAAALRQGGLKVTVRRQRGNSADAACGQLRLREQAAGQGSPAT